MRGAVWMAVLVMLLAAPRAAHAAVNWLTVRGTCPADVERLARRIEQELAGQRPESLALVLELEAGAPTLGRLWLTEGARTLGEKQVEARNCEAALDLLTAVGALALSAPPEPAAHAEAQAAAPSKSSASARDVPGAPQALAPSMSRKDGESLARGSEAQRWRLLAIAGVALGAGAPATVLVTGGAARSWGPGELRLLGRYGLPTTTEEIEDDARSVRRDFGSVAADYCYALDGGRWLSMCGGLELQTRRTRRVVESEQAGTVETVRRAALLAPTAGLLLVLRRVVAQPQLELSGLVPVWGAAPGFGFRAALGGGLPF